MSNPTIPGRVSAIIPSYNHEKFVAQAIQSVIGQTYQDIELIVIDDGSKDGSVTIIESMADACKKRFSRFEFRTRSNVGLAKTLDEALGWALGEYVAFLASDDMWLPGKTGAQVRDLKFNSGVSAQFGGVVVVDDKGETIEVRSSRSNSAIKFDDIFLSRRTLPSPVSGLYCMNALKAVSGFSTNLICEDLHLILKLLDRGLIIIETNEVVACYRRHGGNTSGLSNLRKLQEHHLVCLRQYNYLPSYRAAEKEFILRCFQVASVHDKQLASTLLFKSASHFYTVGFVWGVILFMLPNALSQRLASAKAWLGKK
jgi:alpha-1,3-rhamnosyltransferase